STRPSSTPCWRWSSSGRGWPAVTQSKRVLALHQGGTSEGPICACLQGLPRLPSRRRFRLGRAMFTGEAPLESALHGHHNVWLVILSAAVAIMASFVALDLAGRIRETRGRPQLGWWIAGAVAMGGGIWSMHFVAMLAFGLGIPVMYDVAITALSMAI